MDHLDRKVSLGYEDHRANLVRVGNKAHQDPEDHLDQAARLERQDLQVKLEDWAPLETEDRRYDWFLLCID